MKNFRLLFLTLLLVFSQFTLPQRSVAALSTNIVISQVYGAGGNTGALYTNDYIELFNRGNDTVNLAGLSVQYAAGQGNLNFVATPLVGSLAPGQYFLVQLSGGIPGAPLPTPDLISATNINGVNGKIIVASIATDLPCNGSTDPCSPAELAQIVDLVGYGSANFFEGPAAAPFASVTTAVFRNSAGCAETDDNSADFSASAPAPRNSASPVHLCGPVLPNLSINDVSLAEGNSGTSTASFTVSLSAPAPVGGVTFDIATADGTATGGVDFVANSLSARSIAQGASSYSFDVTVNGDSLVEPDETFFVNLTNVSGALLTDAQGLGTILNDDLTLPSTNADLSALVISSGTLAPAFSANTLAYTANVDHAITALTVTPTVADVTASVTVNGVGVVSGSASASIPLNVGDNLITVVVTAEDGTTIRTYTITVTRALSSNADLSALVISSGTLAPTFSANTLAYTANVDHAITALTVTPTVADVTASVTVNGVVVVSGSPSALLPLNVGDNLITVVVTAEDGTTIRTYTITVTRALSSNADLSALVISSGALTPSFGAAVYTYTASMPYSVSSLTVTPTLADPTAAVTVNGTVVASGSASAPIALSVGSGNLISVVVTAQDGTTQHTYTINVTRAAASTNASLASLVISSGTLTPGFNPALFGYTVSVANAVSSLSVTPTLADLTASVTVNGVAVASGSASALIPLTAGGVTPISVVVTAQDGTSQHSYTINVTRAPAIHTVSGNAGIGGAIITYTGGSTTADAVSGLYSFTVASGWTGTITPAKTGYAFTPASITRSTPLLADLPGQNFSAAMRASFQDVPTSYWAWLPIEVLYANGITSGCGTLPLTYCPDSAVTRAQMAVFLLKSKYGAGFVPDAPTGLFQDVPVTYWAARWIEKLYADGITSGCSVSPLKYCPEDQVTRAQMAVFLLKSKNGSAYLPPAAIGKFSDVPLTYWAVRWIEQLSADGITSGCGGNNYCPEQSVTRAQMAVFLSRSFGLH